MQQQHLNLNRQCMPLLGCLPSRGIHTDREIPDDPLTG
jgi:hypothetical protein